MADCECLAGCIFFNEKMKDMPATAEILKTKFCRGNNTLCARFIIFKELGREKVPFDLFPNQNDRAQEILKKEKNT